MDYEYNSDIASLKYDLQHIVYNLDRAIFMSGYDKTWYFNQALNLLDDVIFKVQAFKQDQDIEQQADMADYIRRLEDEIPY